MSLESRVTRRLCYGKDDRGNLRWPVTHDRTSPGVRGERQLLTCFLQAYGHVMVSCLLKALGTSVNKTQHCPITRPDPLDATSCDRKVNIFRGQQRRNEKGKEGQEGRGERSSDVIPLPPIHFQCQQEQREEGREGEGKGGEERTGLSI